MKTPPINIEKQAVLDIGAGLSEHNVHDEYKTLTIEQRQLICQREQLAYDVAIVNVTGEINLSNIIRTSSLCGASTVWILGRRKYDKRGTVGAENYVKVNRISALDESNPLVADVDKIYQTFEENNLQPIFVEQFNDTDCLKIDSDKDLIDVLRLIHGEAKKPVFVFGNENRGIPHDLINKYPYSHRYVFQLVQKGVIRSFNVSSTAAIVLYKVMTIFE